MDYLLKASGLVIILFLFYYFFLKNETFFKSIRSYFLIGLIIVVSIPLVEIPIYVEQTVSQFKAVNFTEISSTQLISQESFNWLQLITIAYLIGAVFFCLKFFIQLISLGYLLSKHEFIKQGNYYFVETLKNISPFSFFNIIIYNKNQFSIDELEQIINHEKAHVLQWHSVDTILAHLLVITLWFNPFVWLYKKAVQQNLEFLADAYALEMAQNQKLYKLTLLKTCSSNFCTEITNNFYNSLIKKRIDMLHKKRSKNKSQWKYALLLPLITAFIITFNTKTIAQEKKLVEIEEVDNLKVELLIDKNSTNETLKEETDFFKKEFNIVLNFKGIKRNSDNEITAIKINTKGDNIKAMFENKGNEPIKPIKISYDSNANSVSIGNVKELHDKHYSNNIHIISDTKIDKPDAKGKNYIFVTSDGDKKTWTSKGDKKENIVFFSNNGNDSIVKKETIILKGDHENVWIQENDENEKITININDEVEDGENIFVLKENGEKGKLHKVKIKKGKFISDGGVIIKNNNKFSDDSYVKEKNIMVFSSDKEKPIIYINGNLSTNEALKELDPNIIEKMEVLKGDNAIKEYGEKAKNGVILITTKKK
ncbi:beta-lactamase regulating signal transducer with metallopeptidase domain [Lutibacter oceani]|uniref:Beta-lactamase regulating signal transducer with metallopeptidase domain n=1 Tax=Lutibacter oceani TaxID=1853311 RepID=A0A3D9RK66_9FLAO|nr:M56 family metallopeptidase [Lutibacter oceani]REE80273.1 beta-lactamase regulating signal transducer with metallopeptidase domain [Lutibacter oceani]